MYCLIIYMLESDLFSKESNNSIAIHTRTHTRTHARTHSDARMLFVRHTHKHEFNRSDDSEAQFFKYIMLYVYIFY